MKAFPAKIRYTALSLPYHIGNGVSGGCRSSVCRYQRKLQEIFTFELYYLMSSFDYVHLRRLAPLARISIIQNLGRNSAAICRDTDER